MYVQLGRDFTKANTFLAKLLSVDEELIICRCTEIQLIRIGKKLNLLDSTIYSAIIFFKRYYLNQSVTTWNPIYVATACLFLAEKLQDGKASNLGRIIKELNLSETASNNMMSTIVRWLEPDLLNGLKFHLRIFLPFRPLTGLMIEISNKSKTQRKLEHWRIWKDESYSLVINALRSDAPLLLSASQIALDAIRLAAFKTLPEKQLNKDGKADYLKDFSVGDAQEDFNTFITAQNIEKAVSHEINVEFYLPKIENGQSGQKTLNKRKALEKKSFTLSAINARVQAQQMAEENKMIMEG